MDTPYNYFYIYLIWYARRIFEILHFGTIFFLLYTLTRAVYKYFDKICTSYQFKFSFNMMFFYKIHVFTKKLAKFLHCVNYES